jgi:hypothetical protein
MDESPLVGGGPKKRKQPKKETKKKTNSTAKKTIKDRIKEGAKVYVGERGGMYIVYDGKKHRVTC